MPGFNLYLDSKEWMFATESLLRYHFKSLKKLRIWRLLNPRYVRGPFSRV